MFVRVGAGPGDPDLLGLRACELLRSADVVVAATPELAALARSLVGPATELHLADAWFGAAAASAAPLVVHLVPGDGLGPVQGGEPIPDDIVAGPAFDVVERSLGRMANVRDVRPLRGLSVVVTRAADQAAGLATPLRRLGATVVELPTIVIGAPADGGAALARALSRIEQYRWLVLTSVNGVRWVLERLPDARRLAGVSLAAIGPATAEALGAAHLPADLVPPRFVAESLLEVFPPAGGDRGARVLVARAAVARDTLPVGLEALGWQVDVVEAYRTATPELDTHQRDVAVGADVVCFTAPSTFTRFVDLVGPTRLPPVVACIGPVTAAAVRAAGVEVQVEAPTHTMAGLVDALVRWVELS